jgi:hypothetical protein
VYGPSALEACLDLGGEGGQFRVDELKKPVPLGPIRRVIGEDAGLRDTTSPVHQDREA